MRDEKTRSHKKKKKQNTSGCTRIHTLFFRPSLSLSLARSLSLAISLSLSLSLSLTLALSLSLLLSRFLAFSRALSLARALSSPSPSLSRYLSQRL